jgi:Uma2 family endonuclease
MSVMTAPVAGLDLPDHRPLTVADLDLTPEDGRKYELDDGVLVVSPAPANNHQLVVSRLNTALAAACPPEFVVLPGPGVEMSEIQYRVPDLVVLRIAAFDIEGKSVRTTPELVIEVASPSTAHYDRNRKKDVYAGFGIGSYWIVVPSIDEPRLTAFELRRGAYRQVAEVSTDEAFRTRRPFPVEVVPSALVAGPWRQ